MTTSSYRARTALLVPNGEGAVRIVLYGNCNLFFVSSWTDGQERVAGKARWANNDRSSSRIRHAEETKTRGAALSLVPLKRRAQQREYEREEG